MVNDPRGSLVEASIQLLFILLDYTPPVDIARSMQIRQQQQQQQGEKGGGASAEGNSSATAVATREGEETGMGNLFCSFLSRLHQSDVKKIFFFIPKKYFSLFYRTLS